MLKMIKHGRIKWKKLGCNEGEEKIKISLEHKKYINNKYERYDSVCRHAMRTATPFFWGDAPVYGDPEKAEIVAGEAAEFGLRDGYLVPLYSRNHWQSVISMSAPEKLDLSVAEQGAVNLLAIYAASAIEKRLRLDDRKVLLSKRELEILAFFIRGKTAWETSRILSISEDTVRFHCKNIRAKLNAANMVHAAAKAIHSELIPRHQLPELVGDRRKFN